MPQAFHDPPPTADGDVVLLEWIKKISIILRCVLFRAMPVCMVAQISLCVLFGVLSGVVLLLIVRLETKQKEENHGEGECSLTERVYLLVFQRGVIRYFKETLPYSQV